MAPKKTRSTALARTPHVASVAHLSGSDRRILEEALRRGEDLRGELEMKTLEFGRYLLAKVFDNDTAAALDDKSDNAVWLELSRRAGGPSLGISRHLLYVALRVAANDRRINSAAWRGLDVGRKELLLPLRDQQQIVLAAKHISDFNLSQPKTREYVTSMLASAGTPRRTRLTPATFGSRLRRIRATLGGGATTTRVRSMAGELKTNERKAILTELEGLRDTVAEMLRALKVR